jgi:glucose/arabinose dehydrogenase
METSSMFRPLLLVLLLAPLISSSATAAEVDQSPLPLTAKRAFPALKFRRPIVLTHAGDGSDRVFIASQYGKIHVLPNDQAAEATEIFLDIEDRVVYKDKQNEEGFLGLAFHPKYKENGELYVYYTTQDEPQTSVISRFGVSKNNPNRADPDSEEELMRIEQPFWNHNGGTIAFGPDGYLYISLGDGGKGNDTLMNGQNVQTLLGSVLRIDVDRDTPKDPKNKSSVALPYAIPNDNPFADAGLLARGEIWAYGFRNPWRHSFDRRTGKLWLADVGQNLWEEIDIVHRGGNYGWNLREGQHKFGPAGSEPRGDLVEPIWEYHHDIGKSITGGHVYRGRRLPKLAGGYLYADYVTGKLWALWYDDEAKQVTANRPIAGNKMPVLSFGEDEAGEVYFLTDVGTVNWLERSAE